MSGMMKLKSMDHNLREWQQPQGHRSIATTRLLAHEQELDTWDSSISKSRDGSTKSRRSNSIPTDTRYSQSASSASEDGIYQQKAHTEDSIDESAKPSRGLALRWQAIALMFGNYAIALLAAILHFAMMYYLNGKPADSRTYLTQRHVTWVSLLLLTGFRASLCTALASAFTQHIWKVLRHKALRVSSIESLHGVRYNPFLLGKWRLLLATPVLYMMAVVIWLLTVAVLFPPSALTIALRSFDRREPLSVPTFDAGYGRDVRIDYTGTSSLSTWTAVPLSHFGTGTDTSTADTMIYSYANTKLEHLAHVVLVAGAVPESSSPCSADCKYDLDFEGPVFQCKDSVQNKTNTVSNIGNAAYYAGGWISRHENEMEHINFDTFTMNTTRILGTTGYPEILRVEERRVLRCEPAWATYQIHLTYINGSRSSTYELVPGGKLADTFVKGVYPDPSAPTDELWNKITVQNLKYLNHYGLLDTIVTALAGSYDQLAPFETDDTFPYTLSNGTTVKFDVSEDISFTYVGSYIEPNKTWIRDTVFNKNRNNLTSDGPSLVITEKLLNEVVANVTIATMFGFYPLSVWNTTVNATMTTHRNTYSFSQPLILILPYSLSLLISLPFLILGYLSMRSNGDAALSDSFFQLLVTMTRSTELDRLTRDYSLGGNKLAAAELKDTRIMYGSLSAKGAGDVTFHRMGFGLEEEITSVRDRPIR